MTVSDLLDRIRAPWLERAARSMARGADVRENFQEQLSRFFDSLVQACQTGDPGWLDQVLSDWAGSSTQSALQEGQKNITPLLNQMIPLTLEIGRDVLPEHEALDLMSAVIPFFTYALEKASNREMEARVAFIAKELSEAEQKLEKLDQSKSNFISVAAHELKTPLTLIEGYASMLRDLTRKVAGNDQAEELLAGINNGMQRLRTIIDDMIDVSLIDNQMLSLSFQPVWLDRIFSLLKNELIHSVITRKQILTIRNFPGAAEMIFADPERLYQAFRNLLSNAIKYTPDGGKVEVDGRLLPGFVEVVISDTGIGISQEDQDLIFAKFGQVGQASLHSSGKIKFKGGGPGLGLPITKGIIEAHGGTVWVESEGYDEVNCPGSTFHILLPLRTEPSDPKLAKLLGFEQTMKVQSP